MTGHWTENEELLDRFSLGRISPDERIELDRHLADCESCRIVLDTHRETVRGIRSVGRLDAKSRLKSHLETRKRRGENLRWMLRVAAVLIVFAGIGLYNRFWMNQPREKIHEQPTAQQTPSAVQRPAQAESKQAGTPDEIVAHRSTAGEERGREGEGARSFADGLAKSRDDLKKEEAPTQLISIAAQPPSAGSGAGQIISVPQPAVPSAGVVMHEMNLSSAKPNQVWAEGTIVRTDRDTKAERSESAMRRGAAQQHLQLLNKQAERKDEANLNRPAQNLYIVRQFGGKPMSKNETADLQPPIAVQALFEFGKSATTIFLDLHPPLSADEESNAQVVRVGADSIDVIVRKMLIRYRIPSASPTQNAVRR